MVVMAERKGEGGKHRLSLVYSFRVSFSDLWDQKGRVCYAGAQVRAGQLHKLPPKLMRASVRPMHALALLFIASPSQQFSTLSLRCFALVVHLSSQSFNPTHHHHHHV